jgi:hypothetical protein
MPLPALSVAEEGVTERVRQLELRARFPPSMAPSCFRKDAASIPTNTRSVCRSWRSDSSSRCAS